MTSCLLFSSLVNQMNLEMLRVKTHQSLLESDTFDRGAFSFFKVAVAHMMLAKACVPVVAGDIMPAGMHSESQACGWNSACETEMTRCCFQDVSWSRIRFNRFQRWRLYEVKQSLLRWCWICLGKTKGEILRSLVSHRITTGNTDVLQHCQCHPMPCSHGAMLARDNLLMRS